MADASPFADWVLETRALARRKSNRFAFKAAGAEIEAAKQALDLSALRKLSFSGQLEPAGKSDWLLTAQLGATAVQPCTITLEPVTTRIDQEVSRRFVAEMPQAALDTEEEDEFGGTAMLEDDTLEPLGPQIDLWAVMIEALALALPDYPRAEGAELGTLSVTEPGKAAMTDEDAKPFAGLASLKDKLTGG